MKTKKLPWACRILGHDFSIRVQHWDKPTAQWIVVDLQCRQCGIKLDDLRQITLFEQEQ